MRKRGQGWRVTEFADEDYETVETMLAKGATKAAVAAKLGVSRKSLMEWIGKGDAGDENWQELARRAHAAEADFQQTLVDVVKMAGAVGDWKAAAWLLERHFPLDFCLERMKRDESDEDDDEQEIASDLWDESSTGHA